VEEPCWEDTACSCRSRIRPRAVRELGLAQGHRRSRAITAMSGSRRHQQRSARMRR
jgi:hypothetical protein